MNLGAFPPNPATAVGRLRIAVGDTAPSPTEPVTTAWGDADPDSTANYSVWGDDQLEGYLALAGGNVWRAAGAAVNTLAIFYAQQGNKQIKADDLGLNISGRGSSLQEIAASFLEQATAADTLEAESLFVIAPLGGRRRDCF